MFKPMFIAAAVLAGVISINGASAEDAAPWWEHVWGASPATSSQNATTAYVARLKADHDRATADIRETLGMMPEFFSLFPENKLAGIWTDFKNAELDPDGAIDAKTKQLIALAVAVRDASPATIYFHTSAALANGATPKEIQETVAVAVIGGTWSEVLTADRFDLVKADTNALVDLGTLKATAAVPTN